MITRGDYMSIVRTTKRVNSDLIYDFMALPISEGQKYLTDKGVFYEDFNGNRYAVATVRVSNSPNDIISTEGLLNTILFEKVKKEDNTFSYNIYYVDDIGGGKYLISGGTGGAGGTQFLPGNGIVLNNNVLSLRLEPKTALRLSTAGLGISVDNSSISVENGQLVVSESWVQSLIQDTDVLSYFDEQNANFNGVLSLENVQNSESYVKIINNTGNGSITIETVGVDELARVGLTIRTGGGPLTLVSGTADTIIDKLKFEQPLPEEQRVVVVNSAGVLNRLRKSQGDVLATEDFVNRRMIYAGSIQPPQYTINGEFITIHELQVNLYDNSTFSGRPNTYTLLDRTFNPVAGVNNYVVGAYNNGAPEFIITQNVEIINESDVVPILTIVKCFDGDIRVIDWDEMGEGRAEKIHQRLVKTERFKRESGLAISVQNRTFSIGSGIVWYGAKRVNIADFNMGSIGHNTMQMVYNGSSWTSTPITELNNSQYNGPNGLVTLTASSHYSVNWIFRAIGVGNTEITYVLLGSESYKLNEALESQVPNAPFVINSQGMLVARVIYLKGSASPYLVQSSFETGFGVSGGGVQEHNELSGRDESDAHIISSITGLDNALDERLKRETTNWKIDNDGNFQIVHKDTDDGEVPIIQISNLEDTIGDTSGYRVKINKKTYIEDLDFGGW